MAGSCAQRMTARPKLFPDPADVRPYLRRITAFFLRGLLHCHDNDRQRCLVQEMQQMRRQVCRHDPTEKSLLKLVGSHFSPVADAGRFCRHPKAFLSLPGIERGCVQTQSKNAQYPGETLEAQVLDCSSLKTLYGLPRQVGKPGQPEVWVSPTALRRS